MKYNNLLFAAQQKTAGIHKYRSVENHLVNFDDTAVAMSARLDNLYSG